MEIQRLSYLVNLLTRCKMAEGSREAAAVEEIRTVLTSLRELFTQKDAQLVQRKMEALSSFSPSLWPGCIWRKELSRSSKPWVTLAGHWFKCPNGHIYVIGDCGGATEGLRLLSVREVIGGKPHTGKKHRLASRDGWSPHPGLRSDTANNLMNCEELQRMM